MNTNNPQWKQWVKRTASLMAVVAMVLSMSAPAHAGRILFEDDSFYNVDSEGIILDANDNGAPGGDIDFQFGNDGTDALFRYNDTTQDITLSTPGGDFDFTDDNLTTTGAINFQNSSEFHIREVADEAAAQCTTLDEVVIDTTENTLYVCTAVGNPGTWTNAAAAASGDLQDAYNNSGAGTREILLGAGGTDAVEVRANANGDDLFQLQNSAATNLIEFADIGGTTIDINSLVVDWDATGAFDIDSTAAVSIGAGAASDFTTTAGALTLDGAGGVNIEGNAAEIDVTTTGAIDMNGGATTFDFSSLALTTTGNTTIDTNTWDISGAGVGSGFTGFSSSGIVTFAASSEFHIREDTDPGANAICTATGELIVDTTDNEVQICTVVGNPGTWENVADSAALDFEDVYANDGDDTLTATGTFDIDAVGAVGIDSDAAVTVGGAGIDLTSDGGIFALTGDGVNDIDISNAGAGIDLDAATFDLLTTSTFSIDGTGASNVTTDTGVLTLSTTTSGDVAINAADDVTITGGDDIIFDDAQMTDVVQLSEVDTAWDASLTSVGIVDNINDLAASVGNNYEDLTFYPEYPDAVVHADGSNNKGTLESFYDAVEETGYYNWTTTNGSTQDIDIRFSFPLPTDFSTSGDFTFNYRTGTGVEADNDVEITLENVTDGATCGSDTTNVNAGAWATDVITAATINGGCAGISAGDIVEVQIKLLDNNGAPDFADVGALIWDYVK